MLIVRHLTTGGYVLGGQSVREVLPAMGHSVHIGVDVRTSGLVPRPRWETIAGSGCGRAP